MSTEIAKKEENKVAKVEASPSERFTNAVMKEFPNGGNGPIELTSFQRKLISNYFIKLDGALKESEVKRLSKSEQYRDALAYSWGNVNMHKLAQDVVAYSSIGLDPLQKNHINPIPYKNSKTNQFDITFIPGFNGLELKAKKYGYDVPDDVIFELKYSTDKFKSIKRSYSNEIENYEFEISDDFNRGELEGGFYYMKYFGEPQKNRLIVMNRHQIEKRKPAYAAAEFWGGEKDNWEWDQAQGKNVKKGKIKVEGWEEEMFIKTLKRHCWDSVNIDSQKIDDNLMRILESESQGVDRAIQEEIDENANGKANPTPLSITQGEDAEYEEITEQEQPEEQAPQPVNGKSQSVNQPSF